MQNLLQTAQKLGLNEEEFDKIKEILKREPNFTELSIYSVMWSEHCSYKNSIVWLKKLPKKGKHILAEAGEENAGLVDIGDGLACAFKIESHNHPSAIEPYQGSATGVGGIHRDIFTMGARPIAALNALRFGNINHPKTKWLVKGVSKGIGDYGNSFGVPTIGGEVYFDESYHTNPLVNAMSIGIVEIGKTISATSYGAGNPVFIVGSATGKDGIHGATFASGDIDENSASNLPSVQVGDPFQEKLLLEATLEAIKTGAIIGMQDMGAAGITCSTSEMSAKGKHGMDIWLDKVPTRQADMKPFEILLSESQERMLIVLKKGEEQSVLDIFAKWDLHCVEIGVVTESENIRYFMHNELAAEVHADSLVLGGGAPVYHREFERPAYLDLIADFKESSIEDLKSVKEALEFLIIEPNIAQKSYIYNQYDSMVQVNTLTANVKADAGIVRLKGSNKGIAAKIDCNPYYVQANPKIGTMIAVAESARNIVCSGGVPVAVTNNLNFGNPYNKEVYYQFKEAILGMSEACLKFDTPVTGGNVSFYNQSSFDGPVLPTPTIGMLGLVNDVNKITGLSFKNSGDLIYLIGYQNDSIGCSQYLIKHKGIKWSDVPFFDLDKEFDMQKSLQTLVENQLLNSLHDVSDGGLLIAMLESSFENEFGFSITSKPETCSRLDAFAFGEGQGRAIASVSKDKSGEVENLLTKSNIPFFQIGSISMESKIDFLGEDLGLIQSYKERFSNSLTETILS